MMVCKELEACINTLPDNSKAFVNYYLAEHTPEYFFTIAASASGKFHPAFALGDGGLQRHTAAAFHIMNELLRMSSYSYMPEQYKEYARIAIILHDTVKYGFGSEPDKTQYAAHGENAAANIAKAWELFFTEPAPEFLLSAVRSHMGQWGKIKPFTNIDRLVHLADYISSRKFIDIDFSKV